ncbi:unnamed protein product [Caenorhabditis bovis]|uniref:PDZ domain-containing protein n=1 Tax=Caenorhabditis bovis TaxID=2654633 RepID=A0A8S1EKQ2_9PELO|nr:unnamed protein product [Caenorhabditis bovis]
MSSNRLAPMPPPKPRSLSNGGRNMYHGGFLTPQDSDTDSGISADCDQGSPKNGFGSVNNSIRRNPDNSNFTKFGGNQFHTIRNQTTADYLTPNSARKIASLSTPRRLPLQPHHATPTLSKTKYRVRFADEVDSGASTSSGASSTHVSPRNDQQEIPLNSALPSTYSQSYTENTIKPLPANEMLRSSSVQQPRSGTLQRNPIRRLPNSSTPQPQPTYATESLNGIADPPPYTIAMQRMRTFEQPTESFRDAYIRRNVADTLQRRYRQRSSSLPRGNKSYYDGIDSFDFQPLQPPAQPSLMVAANQLPGSLDNLHISLGASKRRKLPTAPLMGSSCQLRDDADDLTAYRALQYQMMQETYPRQTLPTFERQPTLLRRTNMQQFNMSPNNLVQKPYENADFGPDGVRAQLIALDQRGYRRVLVEKMMPGPFGFYIATGMVAGQRGIFISRVSLPSLSPMLTVGDEIIYVDEELVKGRSLEYVQSVIAGKTAVTITLLPAVGQPALC